MHSNMENNTLTQRLYPRAASRSAVSVCLFTAALISLITISGCSSPAKHRENADKVAYDIIRQGRKAALGIDEEFDIVQPSDIFRRNIVESQCLLYSDEASLGRDQMDAGNLWPDPTYLDPNIAECDLAELKDPVVLSLFDALQIGAQNSFDYQTQKETIFEKALDLDLEKNEFRSIFGQLLKGGVFSDTTGRRAVSGSVFSSETSVDKKFKNGAEVSSLIAVDLANLLTMGGASSVGLRADASVAIPLLRGSGKHVVTEDLTQAERDVVYAIFTFERFKRVFAVGIADEYLKVLEQLDQVQNTEENYKGLVISVRRARRIADEGQLPEIQVDQAVQDQLRARNRWISAIQRHKQTLDEFKIKLGLPTDARIKLKRSELTDLYERAGQWLEQPKQEELATRESVAADAPIELPPPGASEPGPFEIDSDLGSKVAFENRLDLKVTQGKVYDSQRKAYVAADALRAELTLLGSVESGGRRDGRSAGDEDGRIRHDRTLATGLLTLDFGLERTAERNAYRKSLINLEESMRNLRSKEDQIKLQMRNRERDLLLSRESVLIQAKAVEVAKKRVASTGKFLELGRAQIRDVLEAQESLLDAQNALTTAIKTYRIAELQIQRDMGVLEVNKDGLYKEIDPEVLKNAGN